MYRIPGTCSKISILQKGSAYKNPLEFADHHICFWSASQCKCYNLNFHCKWLSSTYRTGLGVIWHIKHVRSWHSSTAEDNSYHCEATVLEIFVKCAPTKFHHLCVGHCFGYSDISADAKQVTNTTYKLSNHIIYLLSASRNKSSYIHFNCTLSLQYILSSLYIENTGDTH